MLVINVLAPNVYEDCHITGSINVPYDQLAEFVKDKSQDTPMVVYCASYMCPMSKRAWKLLKDLGYTDVRAYEGGAAEWYALGYPTQGPAKMDYLKESYEQPSGQEEIDSISATELKKLL